MSEESAPGPKAKKRTYKKPALRVYGRVRDLTGSMSGSRGGDAGTMMPSSDRRVKSNIVRIGEHPLGIGLYLFDYKPEHQSGRELGRQFGVMADEVEKVLPAAVSVGSDGYQQVDYRMLGISRPTR